MNTTDNNNNMPQYEFTKAFNPDTFVADNEFDSPAKEPEKTPAKPKNFRKFIPFIALFAILLTAAIIVMSHYRSRQRINDRSIVLTIEDFDIKFSGYDTQGTVTVNLNEHKFHNTALKALGYETIDAEARSDLDDLYKEIDVTVSSKTGLANGDILTIYVDLYEETQNRHNVILKDTELSVEVSGLEELKEFNPFDSLIINTTGQDGDISVSMQYKGDALSVIESALVCTPQDGLSYGDAFTISCKSDNLSKDLAAYGLTISSTSQQYTVLENATYEYLKNFNQLSDSFLLTQKETFKNYILNDFKYQYSNILSMDYLEYYGGFLCNFSNSDNPSGLPMNRLYLIYETSVSVCDSNDEPQIEYLLVSIENIIGYSYGAQFPDSNNTFITIPSKTDNNLFGYSSIAEMLEDNIPINELPEDVVSYDEKGKFFGDSLN